MCEDNFQVGLDAATILRFLKFGVPGTSRVLGPEEFAFQDVTLHQVAFDLLLRIKRKAGFKLNFLI